MKTTFKIVKEAILVPFAILLAYDLLAKVDAPIGVIVGFAMGIAFVFNAITWFYHHLQLGAAIRITNLNHNEPIKVLCFCEVGAMDEEAHHRMIVERQDGSVRHLLVWPREMPSTIRTGWIYKIRDGKLVSIRD